MGASDSKVDREIIVNSENSPAVGQGQDKVGIANNVKAREMDLALDELNLVDERYEEKMAAFEVDCNDGEGSGQACHHVGEFFSVIKNDRKRSKIIFENNCYRNNEPYYPSCFNLGKLYLAGKGGLEQDDNKAGIEFKKACDGGHLQACYHLGVLEYINGNGTGIEDKSPSPSPSPSPSSSLSSPSSSSIITTKQRDVEKQINAINILEKACNDGEADSCYFAANYYLNKKNPDNNRNPEKAAKLMEISCTRNNAPSCYNLAVLYKLGDEGVPINLEKHILFKEKTEQLIAGGSSLNGTRAS
jgi:TPR repeat protein